MTACFKTTLALVTLFTLMAAFTLGTVAFAEEILETKAQEITIEAGDKSIFGLLFTPETDEKVPMVICSHGYNSNPGEYEVTVQHLAANGIAALAFDFCGGSVTSRSSGEIADMSLLTEKEDLLAVLEYVKTLSFVDTDKIFLMGASQGGLVTALAAPECVDDIRGIILYYPALGIVKNWTSRYPTDADIPEITELMGMNLAKKFFQDMRGIDVNAAMESFPKKVLILSGDDDPIVPVESVVEAQQVFPDADLVVMAGENHGFTDAGDIRVAKLSTLFIKEHSTK